MTYPNKAFHSAQSGAPVNAGTAGYGISLLDACLVTGFNSKNVSSITVAANVATLTSATAHGFVVGEIILVAGANEAVFNTEFKVLSVPSSTTLTFALTTGLSAASGTMTVKFAPLGWEKAYSGTNKAVYRSQEVTGTRLYLRADDSNAQYLTVNLYETMTGIDTGTGASTTLYWKKSSSSDTTARPWQLIGNSTIFYWFSDWNAAYLLQPNGYAFGDFFSVKSGDAYRCLLIGHNTNAPASAFSGCNFNINRGSANTAGQVMARSFSQLGTSTAFYKESAPASTAMGYGSATVFPNQPDNGVHLAPVYLFESLTNAYRGRLPGLLCPFEAVNGAFPAGDKTVVIDGKPQIAYNLVATANNTYGNCWFNLNEVWG